MFHADALKTIILLGCLVTYPLATIRLSPLTRGSLCALDMLPEENENLEERWFSGYEFRLYEVEIHVNPVLSTLANLFAIYVIVRHSPSHMTTYRWFLLNIVVSSEAL